MAFPTSPSDGDLHTEFGRTFKYASATNSWSVATPDAPVDDTPTTQGYVDTASLPLADVVPGSKAFVEDGNKLFIFTGSGWFEIATVNTAPTITTGANATYELTPNGSPTVITLQATDPEGTPIIWGYQVTSGSLGDTTVTNVDNVFTITPGSTATAFDLSFTASDGVNIDTSASSFTIAVLAGQIQFTSSGTYSWTVPDNVTSISAVCIGGGGAGKTGAGTNSSGGGGGGGGALTYVPSIAVTPGQVLTVTVGAGGPGYAGGAGGDSSIKYGSTYLLRAGGGGGGGSASTGAAGGSKYTYLGGNGGAGGNATGDHGGGGGGGAGGYSGNGGNGSGNSGIGTAGSGGGGGGGGMGAGNYSIYNTRNYKAGCGGGVGIYGEGSSGALATSTAGGGGGGSGGTNGSTGGTQGKFDLDAGSGMYGSGGGGGWSDGTVTGGGVGLGGVNGAVRIIWGAGRAYPSTNTADV